MKSDVVSSLSRREGRARGGGGGPLASVQWNAADGRTDIGRLSMLESRHILLSSITSRVASPARPAGKLQLIGARRQRTATRNDHSRPHYTTTTASAALQPSSTCPLAHGAISRCHAHCALSPNRTTPPPPRPHTQPLSHVHRGRAGGRALTVTVTVTSLSVVNVVQSPSRRIPTTSTGPREFTHSTHNLKIIGKEFQKIVIRRYLERSIQKKFFSNLHSLKIKTIFHEKSSLLSRYMWFVSMVVTSLIGANCECL